MLKTKKVFSCEIGYGFRSDFMNANINGYYTRWNDKALVKSETIKGQTFTANIAGINAIHFGIEFDAYIKPIKNLDVFLMLSIGDWKWAKDVNNVQIFDENQNPVGNPLNLYLKDIHVGDAAQTTLAIGADYNLFEDFKIGFNYNYFANLYADFDTEDITDPNPPDSWKLPNYGLVDLSAKYSFQIVGINTSMYLKANNLFDTEYISEADDGSKHNWETAKVYYGFGRTFSLGFKVKF